MNNEYLEPEEAECVLCHRHFPTDEMVEVEEGVYACETCAVNEYGWQPIPDELLME